MSSWTPGRRTAQRALEVPFEDVPDHLYGPIWAWIEKCFSVAGGYWNGKAIFVLGIDFRLTLTDGRENNYRAGDAMEELEKLCRKDDGAFMLDIVEWILEKQLHPALTDNLSSLLQMGNSAYAVNRDESGLQLRVDPTVQQQIVNSVASANPSAGDHLSTAWNCAYSRTPDPVRSYSESIKAVEAASAPIVSPNNMKATLGTIIGEINANSSDFTFTISSSSTDGPEMVLAMMRLLWTGQTSRHGGVAATRHETPAEAAAAVHLASTLVQWCSSGAFIRR